MKGEIYGYIYFNVNLETAGGTFSIAALGIRLPILITWCSVTASWYSLIMIRYLCIGFLWQELSPELSQVLGI